MFGNEYIFISCYISIVVCLTNEEIEGQHHWLVKLHSDNQAYDQHGNEGGHQNLVLRQVSK